MAIEERFQEPKAARSVCFCINYNKHICRNIELFNSTQEILTRCYTLYTALSNVGFPPPKCMMELAPSPTTTAPANSTTSCHRIRKRKFQSSCSKSCPRRNSRLITCNRTRRSLYASQAHCFCTPSKSLMARLNRRRIIIRLIVAN